MTISIIHRMEILHDIKNRADINKDTLDSYIRNLLDKFIDPSPARTLESVKFTSDRATMTVAFCSGTSDFHGLEGIMRQFEMIADITRYIDEIRTEAIKGFNEVKS